MNLEKLFNPASIAILGASAEEGKVGNVVVKNIFGMGYEGEVYLVNFKHDFLFGRKCYKALEEIEKEVDLAIIAVPAEAVLEEVRKNAQKIKNYVIISAGFSEIGEKGKKREEELKKIAKENDLNILGPNCLGYISPKTGLNASFAGGMPEAGNIALVSQSGALAVAIMDTAKEKNLKFSKIISIGNKAVLDEGEILEYLSNDEETKVVGMYLEGIKSGKKFLEAAQRICRRKPVVVLKAGKTEKSQKAIASHTGSLAGSDKIMSAVFEKTGITRAANLGEFFDFLKIFSFCEPPKNNRITVVTNAGGPGVLASDAFLNKNMELSDISEKTRLKLAKVLPEESALGNPIDLLGDAKDDRYKKTFEIVNKNVDPGNLLVILTPQDQTPVKKIASKIINFKEKTASSVVTSFIGGERIKKSVKKLEESGIANFDFPEKAVNSLDKYYSWKTRLFFESQKNYFDGERKERIAKIVRNAREEGRKGLFFREAGEIMGMYGIEPVETYEINSNGQEIDFWEKDFSKENIFPAVLKVDGGNVIHRTDKKGVVLGIKNEEEMRQAIFRLKENFPGEGLIVQPMLFRQAEIIIGIKFDEVFGPVIVCGLGGIYTEVFDLVDFFIPPLDQKEAEFILKKGKIGFLFQETRGQKPYDINEISKIILGISQFALESSGVVGFDINPLLIYNNGENAKAVDIKILI